MGAERGRKLQTRGRLCLPDLERPRPQGLDVLQLDSSERSTTPSSSPASSFCPRDQNEQLDLYDARVGGGSRKRRPFPAAAKPARDRSQAPALSRAPAAPNSVARATTRHHKHKKSKKKKQAQKEAAQSQRDGQAQPRGLQVSIRKQLPACLGAAILPSPWLSSPPPAPRRTSGSTAPRREPSTATASVDLQAGSHPYEYTLSFATNLDDGPDPEVIPPEGTPPRPPRRSAAGDGRQPARRCPAARGRTSRGCSRGAPGTPRSASPASLPKCCRRSHPGLQPDPAVGSAGQLRLQLAQQQQLPGSLSAPERLRGQRRRHHLTHQGHPVGRSTIWGVPALGAKAGEGHIDERFAAIAWRRHRGLCQRSPPCPLPHPADLLTGTAAHHSQRRLGGGTGCL